MFARLISLIIIFALLYVGAIFVTPDFADTYGYKEWNEKVRTMKRFSELDRVPGSGSIVDRAMDIAKPYSEGSQKLVEGVKNTLDTTKNIIETKTDQAKQAVEATEKAYKSVEEAKQKLENLTTLTGTQRN